jgi:hypothetical protein
MFRFVGLYGNARDAAFPTWEQVKAYVEQGRVRATGMILSPKDTPVAFVVTSKLTMIN